MKKFDLHKIMGNAHKLYKNARAKYNTFSEALKKAWAMAKFEVRIAAGRMELEAECKAEETRKAERKARIDASVKAMKDKVTEVYNWGILTASDIYPENHRGYMGAKYCGD